MITDRSEATGDILLNDRTEKMSDETLFRYRLMQGVNHIVNTALEGKRSRSSWECVGIQYSEFVREIARGSESEFFFGNVVVFRLFHVFHLFSGKCPAKAK